MVSTLYQGSYAISWVLCLWCLRGWGKKQKSQCPLLTLHHHHHLARWTAKLGTFTFPSARVQPCLSITAALPFSLLSSGIPAITISWSLLRGKFSSVFNWHFFNKPKMKNKLWFILFFLVYINMYHTGTWIYLNSGLFFPPQSFYKFEMFSLSFWSCPFGGSTLTLQCMWPLFVLLFFWHTWYPAH